MTDSQIAYHRYSCFFDLSDEIILLICCYLSPTDILYAFYTPDKSTNRLHRVIFDYYTTLKLDQITNNEFIYLSNLFSNDELSFGLQSLILSNEHINCLIQRYLMDPFGDLYIYNHLKFLKLIDLSPETLVFIRLDNLNHLQLKDFHLTIQNFDENPSKNCFIEPCHRWIIQLLFDERINSIRNISIGFNNGLILTKSLIPNEKLRNVSLVLQTIDDLYVLLDGLIPNVEILIIELCQKRILNCPRPKRTQICSRLIEFSLFEDQIEIVIDDIRCIRNFMSNLIKLTLSVRDTPDRIFCSGSQFELILAEYVSRLRYFEYTVTHRIIDQSFIENFLRWPMEISFYSDDENIQWVHIYSLPWPSNRNDKRCLPIIQTECTASQYIKHMIITKQDQLVQLQTHFYRVRQITTCLSIHIKLPLRISKIILTNDAEIVSTNFVQPSVRHLIVERRLNDVEQISILADQFPNVKYLKFLFPLEKSLYINCFKKVFSINEIQRCFWSELIYFSTELINQHLDYVWDHHQLYNWLIQNTDLKYHQYPFYVQFFLQNISIWF